MNGIYKNLFALIIALFLFQVMPIDVLASNTVGSLKWDDTFVEDELEVDKMRAGQTRGIVRTNISSSPVTANATDGNLPPGTLSLTYGDSYYFNMQVTSDVNLKTGTVYIYKNGSLYDTRSYTAAGYFRYTAQPYTFTETGNYSSYWIVTDTNGNRTTTGTLSFSVNYNVSISLSKSSMNFNYEGNSAINTVSISGNGYSSCSFSYGTSGIVSAAWGNWNGNNIPLTITPRAAGTTTVTVYAKDGNGNSIASKSFTVTVNKVSPTLNFSSSSLTKTYGDSAFTNTLTKITDGSVTFSSTNTNVATVNSSTGQVTIKGVGSCTIIADASAGSNYTSGTKSYGLKVDKASPVLSFSSSSIEKTKGDGIFTNILTRITDGNIAYSSSNTNVATVDSSTGQVTIIGVGNCTITAHATEGINYLAGSKSYYLMVNKLSPILTFTDSNITKTYGESNFTNTLTKTTDGIITFSSSNTDIATVNADTGQVTIVGAGDCVITSHASEGINYSSGSQVYSLSVDKAVPLLSFAKPSLQKTYGAETFTNVLDKMTDGNIIFDSSNTDIATVDSKTGLVTITGIGSCMITAYASEGNNYLPGSQTYTLTVSSSDFIYSASGNTAVITGYTGNAKTVAIPNELDGYLVIGIGDKAFYECHTIEELIIQVGSVIKIGDSAFAYCSALEKITIPSTLQEIGESAFEYCSKLGDLMLNNASIRLIGDKAFYMCQSLASVKLNNTTVEFGNEAFAYCMNLVDLSINNCTATFGDKVFAYCTGLKELRLSNSTQKYGTSAFEHCTSLISIIIPGGVHTFGTGTFAYCTSLKEIDMNNGIANVGDRAFAYCSSLTSVNIPGSVAKLGDEVFYYCENLKNVTVPKDVKDIGERIFDKCPDLTISTYNRSAAHNYAIANNIKVNLLDDEIKTYIVEFDSNGGSSVHQQTVKDGEQIVKPTNPTRSGYIFNGWYQDNTLTKAWDFSGKVISNMTLYAKWKTTKNYTVTFKDGKKVLKIQKNIPTGGKAKAPSKPVKKGYVFVGWNKSFSNIKQNMTVSAKWTLIKAQIDSKKGKVKKNKTLKLKVSSNAPIKSVSWKSSNLKNVKIIGDTKKVTVKVKGMKKGKKSTLKATITFKDGTKRTVKRKITVN